MYVYVGMDWLTISSYDYIRNELPKDCDAEDFILYSVALEDFTVSDSNQMAAMPEEYFQLLDHGWLSYIKNKFKYDNQLSTMAAEELPTVLFRLLTADYIDWLRDNDLLVTTDGTQIIIDDRYQVPHVTEEADYDCNGRAAVKAQQLLDKLRMLMIDSQSDDDLLADFEDEEIHLIIHGKVFTFLMTAAVYNGFDDALQNIIDEQ